MKHTMILASLLLCTGVAVAQRTATTEKQEHATADRQAYATTNAQVSLLTTELGLNEKQAAQALELMTQAEREVAPMRAECRKIESKVEATYDGYYARLDLTPEQQEKMATLRKSGKLDACCTAHGTASAGCGDHGKAQGKSAGCCAGGKAHGTTATPAPSKEGARPAPATIK